MQISSLKWLVVVLAALVAGPWAGVWAEEGDVVEAVVEDVAEVDLVEVVGTVSVVKDDLGTITSAVLNVGAGDNVEALAIKLDYTGKALARMAGQDQVVKVAGTVSETEGVKTIAVRTFETVKEEGSSPEE